MPRKPLGRHKRQRGLGQDHASQGSARQTVSTDRAAARPYHTKGKSGTRPRGMRRGQGARHVVGIDYKRSRMIGNKRTSFSSFSKRTSFKDLRSL